MNKVYNAMVVFALASFALACGGGGGGDGSTSNTVMTGESEYFFNAVNFASSTVTQGLLSSNLSDGKFVITGNEVANTVLVDVFDQDGTQVETDLSATITGRIVTFSSTKIPVVALNTWDTSDSKVDFTLTLSSDYDDFTGKFIVYAKDADGKQQSTTYTIADSATFMDPTGNLRLSTSSSN